MDNFHVYYQYPELPKPLVRLLKCVELLNYFARAIAISLGLDPSFGQDYADDAPSVPISSSAAAKPKPRLPVAEYARRGGEVTTCAVCLCDLKAGDEVRELGNCEHAFHGRCIDGWVERGKLTCPICRSALLPAEERKEWKSTLLDFMEKLW
ncbi:E3 ubiquitin-protein ligase RHA1B-like [Iris pallida]|uniref:E3 ubiquitin-protein ligase RHA1B-like n=1 Tax=Iris pallida TaxID=29817 RepID=A0AAX6DTB4_IRIPA|nr:E3 ubiquitin-protein ligase RHA1B-like [Iris pallida]